MFSNYLNDQSSFLIIDDFYHGSMLLKKPIYVELLLFQFNLFWFINLIDILIVGNSIYSRKYRF